MAASADRSYPREGARAADLRLLADEYRSAAASAALLGRAGQPLSRAPFRLLAIHAIELYLNAFLLDHGCTPADLRRLNHDLAARTELARAAGLVLRARTVAHLKVLSERREYLVSRYAPEEAASCTHINRLAATLRELAGKTAPPPAPVARSVCLTDGGTLPALRSLNGQTPPEDLPP